MAKRVRGQLRRAEAASRQDMGRMGLKCEGTGLKSTSLSLLVSDRD